MQPVREKGIAKMASATIPIKKIRVDSTLSTTASRSSALPSPVRRLLRWWLFPHVLRFVLRELSGKLNELSPEQAEALYGPLCQFHYEILEVLAKRTRKSPIDRFLTARWAAQVGAQAARLGDLIESLAWGSDPDLREHIDNALADLQQVG
jgi:hypothetical protein